MQLVTFNEILTSLCDEFDALISPRRMSRSNTNVVYLVLKAVAKGFELINNVCVVLSNKFDPARCSNEDLVSVASLVGTEKHKASASGLHIICSNENESGVTLYTGVYTYVFEEEVIFEFEVLEDTVIPANSTVTFIAMSQSAGKYHVTAQEHINIESVRDINSHLSFSCTDNANLLGTDEETDLEFRKRILGGYDEQDTLVELENQLRNLPYLFDCRLKFNDTDDNISYDSITIPPFTLAIFYSGAPRSDMADVIANKIICPTVQTADSTTITYTSDIFVGGGHDFNIIPFGRVTFGIDITYKIDETFASDYDMRKLMKDTLVTYFIPEVHKDYIKEDDIYNILESLNMAGVDILSVNLTQGGSPVDFISIPLSRIAELDASAVHFTIEGE